MESDSLLVWDDVVFLRERCCTRLDRFLCEKAGPDVVAPARQVLWNVRKATYAKACVSSLRQNVFNIAASYFTACTAVNDEVR